MELARTNLCPAEWGRAAHLQRRMVSPGTWLRPSWLNVPGVLVESVVVERIGVLASRTLAAQPALLQRFGFPWPWLICVLRVLRCALLKNWFAFGGNAVAHGSAGRR